MKYEFHLSEEQEHALEICGMKFEEEVADILTRAERQAMRLKNAELEHVVGGLMSRIRKLLPGSKQA